MAVTSRVPPNEDIPLWVARYLSADHATRTWVQAHLPALLRGMSSRSPSDAINRAVSLFGYSRSADALPAVAALCDELDRAGREAEAIMCLRALASQLPSTELLELLQRKGLRESYTPVCLRALLRLDRRRAASLLAQTPKGRLAPAFLRSAFDALASDEQIQALKELYCASPPPSIALLKEVETICEAEVVVRGHAFHIMTPRAAQAFTDLLPEARTTWLNAQDRTWNAGNKITTLITPKSGDPS